MSADTTNAEQQLLALYDRVADAPDAIQRLRSFVLDLAVWGKLVEQNSDDEPASELAKRIKEEKERLAKEGEFREPRNAVEIRRENLPFVPPSHWVWCRLIEIARPSYGCAFKSSQFNNNKRGMPLIRIRDISKTDTEAYYEGEYDPAYLVRAGDYLVGMDGDFNLRRWEGPDGLLNQRVMRINSWRCGVEPEFVKLPLQIILDYLHGDTSLTTVKHLSAKQVNGIEIPLPPLAEQHRIVAKVEELMALLYHLEATRTAAEFTRDRLAAASLDRLTEPNTTPESFPIYARSIIDALPSITTRGNHIQSLRQTILDLAVRGKLTEREGDDGSGFGLIEMIKAARKQSSKPSLQPDMSEVNFALPPNWAWQSLDDVIIEGPQNGLSPRKVERSDAPKAITLTATTSGFFDAQYFKHVDVNPSEVGNYWLESGDLLFQRGNTREFVGIAAIYDGPSKEFLFPDLIMRVKISPHMDCRFVHLWCIAPFIRQYMSSKATGAQQTMPKINQAVLRATPIAVPSLPEQHRIVAKFDELVALCGRLEVALATADATKQRMLKVLLQKALTGDAHKREAA